MFAGDRLQDKSQQWLSPAHPSTKYDIGREAYHDGTATWFIRGTTCCKWVGSDGDSERAQARASSGSIAPAQLVSVHQPRNNSSTIKEATRLYDAGLASMAYFFFGFKDTAKRDALLCSHIFLFESAINPMHVSKFSVARFRIVIPAPNSPVMTRS
ncbi:hypothetical protein BJY52DRAFT_898981 [Lactarius psammicola]|nr:hypothetical protein BJY52DRAFT_898981 [Lactarius psammicola]